MTEAHRPAPPSPPVSAADSLAETEASRSAKADIPAREDVLTLAETVDHLVDATGDPSVSLRRAMILLDIDQHPNTTQNGIGERLNLEKSVVSRNVDWLWGHGCITRTEGRLDAREHALHASTYTHKHLQLALRPFGQQHEALKNILHRFIGLFHKHMPSLRELKALLAVGFKGEASRSDIINNLYDGPPTTDQRAIRNLIEEGIVDNT
ncbi:MAG: MarR family transcriptional regulator [Rhodospirillales bacterium]|nr:MarR family transcriptional regulator [Alphaproteobacteria bacterium]MCB9987411.1 MarR family transcriptional regulator [Rhodospirillales bacterium]USO07607.1 MAG: MarR family transcriptional regulator [Rhodospirillales bacterium]